MLRNQTVYSVFIRNHSTGGDLAGLVADLDRISDLGVDYIWLLPIHPIGVSGRKGNAGSPYAIQNYRDVNPEYGTLDDFISFINSAHQRKIKIIIDVVFNHSSPDSLLSVVHPDWFWKNPEGKPGNRVGDWADVIDLDYSVQGLWDYQIETLKGWLHHGVDGFRCDVAPLLPLAFWIEARDACAAVNPDTIWIAETVEGSFINRVRRMGFECLTDTETLRAFDVSYEYDVFPDWCALVDRLGRTGGKPKGGRSSAGDSIEEVRRFVQRLKVQESTLGDTDLKLRYLENHDQRRSADRLKDPAALRTWTAYSLFIKGMGLIYAGQEYAVSHKPGLFDTDRVNWATAETAGARAHSDFVAKLIALKKSGIVRDGFFFYPDAPDGVVAAAYERRSPDGRLTGLRLGIFNAAGGNTGGKSWRLKNDWPELMNVPDLTDCLTGRRIPLTGGDLNVDLEPMILDWGLVP
jgi:glycosidase